MDRGLLRAALQPVFVGFAEREALAESRWSSPCGNTRISTGIERNGPEVSTSESHSA